MALISETEIKDYTDIAANVNAKRFSHYIEICEKRDIRGLIGKPLYDRLIEGVDANDLTANEDTLIAKIKPALAWYILFRALPNLHSTITPTGLQTKTTTDGESVGKDILDIRMKNALTQAEFYAEDMRAWLCENSTLFPEWLETDVLNINKKDSGYNNSGIAL